MTPKGRILCTEDDPDTRELLVLTLNEAGFDTTCTESAEDALKRAKKENFDLILLDNWLPGLSGKDLCKEIRQFNQHTPILFYSGAGFEADKQSAMSSGAQGYLVKPVMPDDLVAEVSRLIKQRSHTSSNA